jgi:hypothetical protein
LKGTAQNGSSLFMFQKPKLLCILSKSHISEEYKKIGATKKSNVSTEDLLECPNYYVFL